MIVKISSDAEADIRRAVVFLKRSLSLAGGLGAELARRSVLGASDTGAKNGAGRFRYLG